jgi:hypothetical protein
LPFPRLRITTQGVVVNWLGNKSNTIAAFEKILIVFPR